jgi:hypothetical protein
MKWMMDYDRFTDLKVWLCPILYPDGRMCVGRA